MVVHVVVGAAGVVGGAANGTKSPVGHKMLSLIKIIGKNQFHETTSVQENKTCHFSLQIQVRSLLQFLTGRLWNVSSS